ncbi:MAG: hypothetical protein AAF557_15165 [Pseudomonadota bacterium]
MPFKYSEFEKVLKKDNSNYERILKSDLHALVEELKKSNPNASKVDAEMKKVSKQKWKKYAKTRKYLLGAFPSLEPKLVNFKGKMSKGGGGGIVHILTWESSTGDLDDLADWKVREAVSWKGAKSDVKQYVISEYKSGGKHNGMGNSASTPGNVGTSKDEHSAFGPFSPEVLKYEGKDDLVYEMTQVYEAGVGNAFKAIAGSDCKITRTAKKDGSKVTIEIKKKGLGQTVTNSAKV